LHNFHDTYHRFPSALQLGRNIAASYARPESPGGDSPTGYPWEGVFWSWTFRITPFIEFQNLKDQAVMNTGDSASDPFWQRLGAPTPPPDMRPEIMSVKCKLFHCPSDPRTLYRCEYPSGGQIHYPQLTSYLGVTGRNQFQEAGGQDGILYINSAVRMAQVTDGTSNTLLIGERPSSMNLYYGWQWAGVGDSPYFGATDVVLGVHERALTPSALPDYYREGTIQDPTDKHRYHFWSLHPGGGMWALADGSVRFISYSAGGSQGTGTAVEAMATRDGGETKGD
jgi:hypothetical protein